MSKKHHRKYDPPKHRGHRKGVEPAGLKRWRLSHRRTHDPGRRVKHTYTGPRGGSYFQGPKTRRYDPDRYAKIRHYGHKARGYGGKIEGFFNKHGTIAGFLAALGFGVYTSWNSVQQSFPPGKLDENGNDANGRYLWLLQREYTRLYTTDSKYPVWTPINYLKYKFLGLDPTSGQYVGSSWVIPFWASLVGYIASKTGFVPGRISRPLGKMAKGGLIASIIGALFMPGTKPDPQFNGNVIQTTPQTIGGRTVYAPQNEYVYGK